jgi:hypothetical protein
MGIATHAVLARVSEDTAQIEPPLSCSSAYIFVRITNPRYKCEASPHMKFPYKRSSPEVHNGAFQTHANARGDFIMGKTIIAFAAGVILVCATGASVSAAAQAQTESFAMPRTPDGKPNFTGVYAGPSFAHPDPPGELNTPLTNLDALDWRTLPALTTLGEKMFLRKHTGIEALDNPFGVCLPGGIAGYIQAPYAQEWVQAPNFILIRYEYINNAHRIVWMDGRPHSSNLEPTYLGESIGRWEGDTLVIDTVGFKEWVLDEYGHINNGRGNGPTPGVRWHSDKLHMIERLTWTAPRRVKYEITMEDPTYFVGPWTTEVKMTLQPTWKLQEMICEENNRCKDGKCSESDAQKPTSN